MQDTQGIAFTFLTNDDKMESSENVNTTLANNSIKHKSWNFEVY